MAIAAGIRRRLTAQLHELLLLALGEPAPQAVVDHADAAMRALVERHQQETDLRSGGDISFDEATNYMFYLRRLTITGR